MSQREQFEQWFDANKKNDWLWRVNKVDAFRIWQASRSAALEEAIRATAQARTTSHACDAIRSLDTQKRGE